KYTNTSFSTGAQFFILQDVIGVVDSWESSSWGKINSATTHPRWDSQTHGNGSWAAATNFGSSGAVFWESGTYTQNGGTGTSLADGEVGGRIVVRFNKLNDAQQVIHGTESGGLYDRGPRSLEVYKNTFAYTGLWPTHIGIRGGTAVIHNNTYRLNAAGANNA